MTFYRWLIVAFWLGLIAYWAVSAVGAKRSLGASQTSKEIGLRLIVVALVLIVLAVPPVRQTFRDMQAYQARSVALGIAGVALCAAGVGLAFLGRFYLGRNWGLPGSRKENPELVTSGPINTCAIRSMATSCLGCWARRQAPALSGLCRLFCPAGILSTARAAKRKS